MLSCSSVYYISCISANGIPLSIRVEVKMKKIRQNNQADFFFSIVILLVLLFTVGASIYTFWVLTKPVSCDSQDKVELIGLLAGFYKNNSYWNVRVDNNTFLFDIFDNEYMENLIGYNMSICCCKRHSDVLVYYDFMNAFIEDTKK